MWCHVCIIDFPSIEDFKYHVTRYHSRMSSSESEESEHEIADVSERESDDVNAASNKFEGESYDSDHNMPAEKKSDDSDAYINTSPGLFHYDSDRSITTKNITDNIAAAHTSQDKCYDSDFAENNSCEKTVALNESPSKSSDDDSKTHFSNTLPGELKESNKKSNIKASGSNETPKKQLSILKKRVRRRRKKVKKVAFCEKVFPKKKLSASSHQKDIPEQSDNNETDHSDSSFNEESNPQPVLNFLLPNSTINPHPTSNNNPQPVLNFVNPNSSINSHSTSNNNPIFLFNPFPGQDVNSSATGGQAIQQPYLLLPLNSGATNSAIPKPVNCFTFNSKNIIKWLAKHKELCKKIPYPLPPSFFKSIQTVHKAIFDRYCTASVSEESRAVLKVYEELDCMIHKHINSINNTLNVL